MASSPSFSVILVLKCPRFPDKNIGLGELDAQSSRYIEMVGLLKTPTPMSFDSLVSLLKSGGDGYIYIVGNDELAEFVSKNLVVSPAVATGLVNRYDGHPKRSMVAEPVENTAMGDFFGTFSRGVKMATTHPLSSHESVLISAAGILKAVGGRQVSYNKNEPLNDRLFSFIKELIYDNKSIDKGDNEAAEKLGKQNKDTYPKNRASKAGEILQSPRAFSWRDVARAKKPQQTRGKITILIMSLLYVAASIWSTEARPYPGGGSQSANVTSFEKEKPEDDARHLHCWSFAPTPAPTSPTPIIINDNKKEKEKPEDDAMYLQCWLFAPAPTSLAPSNDIDDKKVKEKLEDDAMHLKCRPFAPTPAPTSAAPINEKKEPKDDAMYLKCWSLAPTPASSSAAHINDDKKDNPKVLFFCGYPCCGFNIHGPCNRCCPKGVLHPPSP